MIDWQELSWIYVLTYNDLIGVTQYIDRIDTNPRLMNDKKLASNEKDNNLISYSDLIATNEETTDGDAEKNKIKAIYAKTYLYDHRHFEEKIVRTLEILSKLSFHQAIVFCNEKNR